MTADEAIDAGLDEIDHLSSLMEGRPPVAHLRERRIVVDPTLVVIEFATRSTATPVSTFEPGILKAPAPVVRAWNAFGQPPERASVDPLRRALALVRQLHAAGIRIVAGSDQGVPGYTLHREIELYVQAGLTPLQAIGAATSVPADVMGAGGEAGRVAAGLRADLLLVEGNPAERIGDLRAVRYVVKGGTLFEPGPLWKAVEFRP
jgi:imidazolonepropionase-like amidohydrolase